MNKHGLTKENLVATLPPALRTDPSVVALAEALGEVLAVRPAEIERLRIYPAIDTLDEPLLDILAHDFKVDWWDPEYSLEEKRRTLKDSWRVHRLLGTRAAVEMAISAIYPHTQVLEWFEYGGEPYHFRLDINITNDSIDSAKQRRVLERLNFYKSLRSHNDGVRYFLVPEKSWAVAGGLFAGSREIDRAKIAIPPLKRPGGEVITIAGGGLTGSRSEGHITIHIPTLQKPGGSAGVSTGGALRGMYRKINAAVDVPELERPKAAASRAAATGFIGSVERVAVRLDAGRVKPPTGRAATAGAAGMFHSYQRIGVTIPATISGR